MKIRFSTFEYKLDKYNKNDYYVEYKNYENKETALIKDASTNNIV